MAERSSVELLRAAAARARELDQEATKGPWSRYDTDVLASNEFGVVNIASCENISEYVAEEANAMYIAAFRSVARPLAAWLEAQAGIAEAYEQLMGMTAAQSVDDDTADAALAVARALLGEGDADG